MSEFDGASYWLGYGVAMLTCLLWWAIGKWASR